MSNPNIHTVLSRLKGVNKMGDYWTARCPAHEDKENSLSVTEEGGNILFNCHTGCDAKDIIYTIGMTWKEMFPPRTNEVVSMKITDTYEYVDEEGVLIYEICRMEGEKNGLPKKDFRQRRPDGEGGYTWKTKGIRKLIYHLPEILSSDPQKPVFVVEGEKQVDYLRSIGLQATCNSGGAGKWLKTFGKFFADRDVVIVPDADEPNGAGIIVGAQHAVKVAESCIDHANSVHILQLPNPEPKWGLDDWLQKGNHDLSELGPLLEACPEFPEGEIVVKVNPQEDEMADPIDQYRDLLSAIGISYCAQNDDQRLEIYSTERKKFSTLPFQIRYPDLIRATGLIAIHKVKENEGDSGDYSMNEVRVALAAVSSVTEFAAEKRGVGVWTVDDHRMAIVGGSQLAILNGAKKLRRSNSPMLEDKAYQIGEGEEWVDFDAVDADLESGDFSEHRKKLGEVVELIEQFRFSSDGCRVPEMLAGLVMASVVQSCWTIRPQVFLTGATYTGKTTLMNMLAKLLGKLCKRYSSPSAAAIRAIIRQSSRILMLDEVERSRHRVEIFEMMRTCARGDAIPRSTASQVAREYRIMNIFWCAAIEPGTVAQADKTRFIMADLVKAEKVPQFPPDEELEKLGSFLIRLAILTHRDAQKLITDLSESPVAAEYGRLNECYAIPAACYGAAMGYGVDETLVLYQEMMAALKNDEEIDTEHDELLLGIFNSEIRNGSEVLRVGQNLVHPNGFNEDTIASNGVKKDTFGRSGERYYFFNRGLLRKQILSDKQWQNVRVDLLLMRFPGATRTRKVFVSGQGALQCVAIPLEKVHEMLEREVAAVPEAQELDPFGDPVTNS